MKEYLDLVKYVLNNGVRKENRTGIDTITTFGYHYNYDLKNGFPLLTTKKMAWKSLVHELLWFLSGSNNIQEFRNYSRIWNEWADDEGNLDTAYGWYWRHFPSPNEGQMISTKPGGYPIGYEWQFPEHTVQFIDQIQNVVDEIRRNPNSRRLVVSAWEPGNAWKSKLPPCHLLYVFNVLDGKLNLHLTQRSADVSLGVPFNIASYSLLLCLIAKYVGLESGIFSHTLIDAHIYTDKLDGGMAEYDHIPGLREQLTRLPRALPKLILPDNSVINDVLFSHKYQPELVSHFKLENYDPYPTINFKVAV